MRAFVRSLVTLAILVMAMVAALVLSPLEGNAAGVSRSDYSFPYHDPYFATLTVRLLKVRSVAPQAIVIPALPGRDSTPIFEGRAATTLSLYVQSKAAPLIYLIPGVGGTATDGSVLWLAESLYSRGFSVLIAPSPLYWQFVLGQSTTAIPGFTPADVADLRRVFLQGRKVAERQYGMKVTRAAVMGFSLGGVNAGYLMHTERALAPNEPHLGIERAVMINPPLYLPHAIATLDRLYEVGKQWPLEDRKLLWGTVLNRGAGALGRDIRDPNYFYGLDRVMALSTDQSKFLIGDTFRQTLTDAIFVSQQINDIGLLKTPATSSRRSSRMSEASLITFARYMEKAAWPFWTKQLGETLSLSEFVSRGDLWSLREEIAKDQAYRLLHNADDFLTESEKLLSLADQMGNRAIVYPYGGHVGNLWNQTNLNDIAGMVSDLL